MFCKILISVLSIFTLSGCTHFFSTNELDVPKNQHVGNLVIKFDFEAVSEIEKATIYEVEFMELDEAPILELFTDTMSYGVFNEEFAAFNGGLNESIGKYESVVTFEPRHFIGSYLSIRNDGAYQSKVDLEFETFETVLNNVELLLQIIGMPDLDLAETYSLDLESLEKQTLKYLTAIFNDEEIAKMFPINESELKSTAQDLEVPIEDLEELNSIIQWSIEDEAYLFLFRQIIDGIPVTNMMWRNAPVGDQGNITPSLWILYSQCGLESLNFNRLIQVSNPLEEIDIITKQQALSSLMEHYENELTFNEIEILTMELMYLNLEASILTPVWLFGGKQIFEEYEEYFYIGVDAQTGEVLNW